MVEFCGWVVKGGRMLRPYLPHPCHEGTVKRRDFIHTVGAATAGGMLSRAPFGFAKKLNRIGLETYAVRHAMAQDPERTLAPVRAIGCTDVVLLWSFNRFGRTPQHGAATLK